MDSGSRPIVADTEFLGVSAPPQGVYLPNLVNPVFRLPTVRVSDETPHHRLVFSDRRVRELEQAVSATRQTISALCDRGIRPPQSLLDSASSLSRDLEDAKQSSSVFRGESRPPSSQPGVSSPSKRFADTTPVQPGPSHPEGDPASTGPSRRRSYNSPPCLFGHSSRQGSDTPPRKSVGSRTIRLPMRVNRLQLADNGTISRMKRTIFVLLLGSFAGLHHQKVSSRLQALGPAFLQTISRLRGCGSGGRVVSAVLQSRLVWTYANRLRFGPDEV